VKRIGFASAIVILTIGLAGPARAVPPGFTLEFDGKGEGKVTFSGAAHSTRAKPHCADCHMELFDVSRSSQITRADHKRKQFCFVCHDGGKAFAARGNCDRCHVEPEVPVVESLPAPAAQ
jgi:c(7)-type cytochrome triheme protein